MINKKYLANIMIAVGIICLLLAAVLALANEYENRASVAYENEVIKVMTDMVNSASKSENTDKSTDLAGDEISEYYNMPVCEIDGNNYIGYLSFDSIDNIFPVMEEWDYTKLKKSPCRYSGSLSEHNLVVAGHNYRSGFGKLKKLKEGEKVYFTAMDGYIYEFVVEIIEVMGPEEIEAMTNSPWGLSLYTCTYEGKARYTIRCRENQIYK